ncbi:MAG TPA: hypothetical protein VM639_07870 [Dongiaceae bacterium]|nr:hypothetical protein [Dongiaceae bacterium]
MLTLEDCIAFSELMPEEIEAIAEHEHIPAIIATELGNYLLRLPNGPETICAMMRDDITAAVAHKDFRHSARLKLVLRHFIEHSYRKALVSQAGGMG